MHKAAGVREADEKSDGGMGCTYPWGPPAHSPGLSSCELEREDEDEQGPGCGPGGGTWGSALSGFTHSLRFLLRHTHNTSELNVNASILPPLSALQKNCHTLHLSPVLFLHYTSILQHQHLDTTTSTSQTLMIIRYTLPQESFHTKDTSPRNSHTRLSITHQ